MSQALPQGKMSPSQKTMATIPLTQKTLTLRQVYRKKVAALLQ